MKALRTAAIAGVAVLAIGGLAAWLFWTDIAVATAPKKAAATERSAAAKAADDLFWEAFHSGDYASIQPVLDALTAAYLETPNDAVTAAHIAWSHNWRMAERARLGPTPATITDDTALARRYFQEAVKINPSDPRTRGFLAGHMLIEGNLHKDEKLTREGYFAMRDAIDAWPEFNMFTGGFVFSRLPAGNPRFQEGLDWQWKTLDICIGGKLDRENPNYAAYMHLETTEGPKRACWNSWIAPHNLEGFFLNMGDMLVKSGDWRMAQKIYGNAKLLKSYADWDFQQTLDARIAGAEANVAVFNKPPGEGARMMIESEFACMACHQE